MEKPSSTSSAQGAAQQVTREDIYELVWREPMLRVVERHAVSSSFLARVCSVMNVPRPPRGYWAKLEFGKAVPQPALPDLDQVSAGMRAVAAEMARRLAQR